MYLRIRHKNGTTYSEIIFRYLKDLVNINLVY